jgi:hypothetical protein
MLRPTLFGCRTRGTKEVNITIAALVFPFVQYHGAFVYLAINFFQSLTSNLGMGDCATKQLESATRRWPQYVL